MHLFSTLVPALGLFAHLSTAAYTLQDDYGTTDAFFDKFDFYTDSDPTNGYVDFVDRSTARNSGLISTAGGSVYIGVDHKNVSSKPGRQSVRLTSTKTYNHGLVILDLAHMPGSICGSWPAFWMLGSNWPNNGEIDIIEGVHEQATNQMTLHTSSGCSINNSGFSGHLDTSNCDVEAANQAANAGCAIASTSDQSYGSGFNKADGGIYATEWKSDSINVWFFPNGSAPSDILGGSPNPSSWGTPAAKFAGNCDIDSHFKDLQIVFDITFCGDWAGAAWSTSGCASKASTCDDFVGKNPSAFTETYWGINALKVYQDGNTTKRDLGSHAHAKANLRADVPVAGENNSRRSTHLRPPTRPLWKHRRAGYKHGQ